MLVHLFINIWGEKNTITDEKLIELGKNEKYHNILAPSHCKLSEALVQIF